MEANVFFENVERDNNLIGVGVTDVSVLVSNKTNKVTFNIPFSTVNESSWETLEEILSGKREPTVLHHISRIVGYFSTVDNWNASKKQEFSARQRGQYNV